MKRAVAWLERVQNDDGGFGEDCRSYDSGADGIAWRAAASRRLRKRHGPCSASTWPARQAHPPRREPSDGSPRTSTPTAGGARSTSRGRPARLPHQLPPVPHGVARVGARSRARGAPPLKVYVTGASGFVGSHVARELRERRRRRGRARRSARPSRAPARDGRKDAVVHVAALYSYDDTDPALIKRVTWRGPENVLDACARPEVGHVVFYEHGGHLRPVAGRPATEEDAPPTWELSVPYKRTKLAAERIALEAGAIVVNPTTPVGEGDRKPTPTGRMIAGVARGRIRGFVATTGLNVVDVRDVARGHALALEGGRPRERYLLGGVNLPLEELFAALADLAGRGRPNIRVLMLSPWPRARRDSSTRTRCGWHACPCTSRPRRRKICSATRQGR